ncbi:glutathione peroxidase [Conidiobolus coronatus NRRL 28638]|uniref:Glutathione peroxidase n=1 Tax=Conidiobolus coronatus (strain ATCC 28846 / CBS 209.66 / NRRL 28638) TaxID=796925 RepID=A0A137P9J3_CONC2|nr:glutathione peroxidase [Conidiobolus coronatus NRRL 28638]|eukprot:KXN71676.1 glutathione peroxidase [Conidiobolus coronatus NRRL 28638]
MTNDTQVNSFYELKGTDINGNTFTFDRFKNKVVLIVNTACACGFTPQLKGLQELHDKYNTKGLEVVGFPSNSFNQDQAEGQELIDSYVNKHGVKFLLMQKSDVNGDNTNEVFKYLKSQKSGLLGTTFIKWNFEKFLVDRNGEVVKRYSSKGTPEEIAKDIEPLL